MDRKYKQQGYQDAGKRSEPEPTKPRPALHDGPKSPRMMAFEGVVRCASCGARVELLGIDVDTTCPTCKADLRTCRNCTNFDPAARFQCRASVSVRVPNKAARTECELFSARRTVEKKTGETRASSGQSDDPRAAFDRLFKK